MNGWQEILIATAGVLGSLMVIFTAIAKIPPLRWLVTFLGRKVVAPAWRAVVSKPITAWLNQTLHVAVCPLIRHSIQEGLAPAVDDSVERRLPAAIDGAVRAAVQPVYASLGELHAASVQNREQLEGVKTDVAELRTIVERPTRVVVHSEATMTSVPDDDEAPVSP